VQKNVRKYCHNWQKNDRGCFYVSKMVRVNTRISSELNDWLDKESIRTGVPKSTIIHLALTTYMQQQRAMSSIEEVVKRLDRIEEQMGNKAKVEEIEAEPAGNVVANP